MGVGPNRSFPGLQPLSEAHSISLDQDSGHEKGPMVIASDITHLSQRKVASQACPEVGPVGEGRSIKLETRSQILKADSLTV